MAKINKPHRKKSTKRLDLTAIKQVLKDTRQWCCLGVVLASETSGPHFDLDDEGLTVGVELQPSKQIITAHVGSSVGSFGAGVWMVPPVGAQVYVLIPDGNIEHEPVIVSLGSSGSMPDDVGINTLVIAAPPGGEVYIHDGSGSVEPVITKTQFDSHVHPTGVGPSGTPNNASTSGTTVFKAK